jgi:hypothetical protein
MLYAVINMTNYDIGYDPVGTFRSAKRAEEIRKRLAKYASENDSYTIIALRALDGFTDDSIVDAYKKVIVD